MKNLFTKLLMLIVVCLTISSNVFTETITSIQDGNWNSTETWNGGTVPTTADSVVVQHMIEIYDGDSCMHLYVAPQGTIQNKINASRTLVIQGNLRVDGTATFTNNYFSIRLGGNLYLNGAWDSPQLFFTGSSEQIISAAPGKIFEATRSGVEFEDVNPASPVKFASDLTFVDVRLLFNDGTLIFAPGIAVTLYQEELQGANVIGNYSTLALYDDSFVADCALENLTLGGVFTVGGNVVATGEIINADTLQNLINGTRTLEVFGNFTNLGVIRNTNNYMNLIIHGNLTNGGEWTDGNVYFDGTTDHSLHFASGKFIDCGEFRNLNPAGKLILVSDIEIHGGAVQPNEGVIEANNHLITLRENAYVDACTIIDPQLGGQFKVNSGVVLSGNVQVIDSLMIRNIYSHQLITIDGDLMNNGFVCRNPFSLTYGLQIDLTGNLENNGLFEVERLRFTGAQDQHVSSAQKGTELTIDLLLDSDPATEIIFDSGVTLINCDTDLDGTTLQLDNVNLHLVDGYIHDGSLNSQQNIIHLSQDAYMMRMNISETHLGGDCHITGSENHFANVTVDDTLRNRNISGVVFLTTAGDFINNGVITSYNTYHIDLHVEGHFYNHGDALLDELTFTGTGIQEFSGADGIIREAEIKNAKTEGDVLVVDDLHLEQCVVSFSDQTLHLQNGGIYADGGQIRYIEIIGNGNAVEIWNDGYLFDVILTDVILKNNVGMRGTNNIFTNIVVDDTLSRGGNYYHDIEITVKENLLNNGFVASDNNSYNFIFFVEDTIVNNGIFRAEKIQFAGSGIHYIESLDGNAFEVDQILNPANGGPVDVTTDLLVKNATLDFNGYELNLPVGSLLQLDNSTLDNAVVNCADNSVITGLNESLIKYSTISGADFLGDFELGEDNIFNHCVIDAMMINDNLYSDIALNLDGLTENNNTLQNRPSWSYELYLNVLGDLMHDGVIECEEARWRGTVDQDIYLLNGNEINTPCEFDAMSMSAPFQWYKNDILIGGETDAQYNLPMIGVDHRGYYHCETGEGSSRTIRICTPVEIHLAAEAWFCQYETVTLQPEITFGEPPYTWSWTPAEGLSDPYAQYPEANPAEPTLYTLLVTDAIGCAGQIDILVQQYPQLFADAGEDKEICFGQEIMLSGSASGGNPGYGFEWSPATGLSNPHIATPVASPESTTQYTLTVTDQNGCSETGQVTVTVNPLPQDFTLACDSAHFCYAQDTIICWLQGSQVGVNYELTVNGISNPGGEVYPGTGDPIALWAATTLQGHYRLKAVDATTGCEKMMPDSMMIFIDYLPEVVAQSGDEEMIECESTTLWVETTSTQPPWFQWFKDGETIPGAESDELLLDNVSLDDTGEYWCVIMNNCDVTQSEPVTILVLQQHTVEIPAGWSGFSTWLDLHDPELPAIFGELEENLVIVSDFNSIYWPAGGVNTYLEWITQRGAQIKLLEAATIDIRGIQTFDQTLELDAGWHYLPVLSQCTVDADELFAPLGDAVAVVKEIAGTGLYWPDYDIYTLQGVEPGRAYFLKVNQPVSLAFGDCLKQTPKLHVPAKPENSSPWPDPACTAESHIIAVPSGVAPEFLRTGDWMGVFSPAGVCSGLARYNGGNLAITVFADDPTEVAVIGMQEFEPMTFRIYKQSTGEIFEIESRFSAKYDDERFKPNGISVIETVVTSGINQHEISVFPNPAVDFITVSGVEPGTVWQLCNTGGILISEGTFDGDMIIGLENVKPGLYTLRISANSTMNYRKVMVK